MASDNSVVVSAPSVEEAVIIGLTRLTALREEVDIEVLDEGSKGFLGLGSRAAQVRLTRHPQGETGTPLLSPTRDADPQAHQSDASSSDASSQTEPEQEAEQKPAQPVAVALQSNPPAGETADATSVETEKVDTPSVAPDPAPGEPEPQRTAAPPRPKPQASAQARVADGLDRGKIEAAAREIIENLLPGLEVDAAIEWIDEDRPTLWVSVGGKDADSLVGPRARNLHALQYLFRALIYHRVDGSYNVVVDADGYRRRRRRSLESMARSRANQAVEQGKVVRLRSMPAHERRIIHIVLREDERVTTESVGRGRDRAVTIIPVGSASSRNGS